MDVAINPAKPALDLALCACLFVAVFPRILDHMGPKGDSMPRKVRDSSLETRTARAKLKARHKPYYRLIAPGLHIGYRKPRSGPGAWVARRYGGAGNYSVENLRTSDGLLVLADDYSDADGARVLTFAQAQQKAS